MDPLAWLGLRKDRSATARLGAITAAVRLLLPDDEPVVVRYIVVVATLLTRVAQSDGSVRDCELDHLRELFTHIDRMPPNAIDTLCDVLDTQVPRLSEEELELCYRELKALCDGRERLQVMRLLAHQATSDGSIVATEHGTLMAIAEALDVPAEAMAEVELEALTARPPAVISAPLATPPDDAPEPAER